MNYAHILVDLLFPKFSDTSSSLYHYIDRSLIEPQAEFLKKPNSLLIELVYVSLKYKGFVSDLLDRIKLGGEYAIADEIADIFADRVWGDSSFFIPTPDIVVPVPADPKRYIQRGFHLSSILAKAVTKRITKDLHSVEYVELLYKKKTTKPQSSLKKIDRLNNNKDKFFVDQNVLITCGKIEYIWLIDDIVATQSTICECAKKLKTIFPKSKIYAVVLSGN